MLQLACGIIALTVAALTVVAALYYGWDIVQHTTLKPKSFWDKLHADVFTHDAVPKQQQG
jgi:hypothetical protein